MSNVTDAQKRAHQRYEEKRAGKARLNAYLSEDEDKLVNIAAKEFGDRKKGVIGALQFWKKYKDKV